mmetsp:Transcript_50401/g.88652  ORF Transcript_50401/g.88652 Transcript_50401/m.88652 type:complete len:434 (-) Transcript_50401:96-1397(-)
MHSVDESISPGTSAANKARNDFLRMAVSFSITHGCAVTMLAYATTLLSEHAGLVGNGVLYVSTFISSLFFAAPAIQTIGYHKGLLMGLGFYSLYVLSFFLSLFAPTGVQVALFSLGSFVGGLGAGVMWTSQGGYMTYTAGFIASWTSEPRSEITTMLASQFATVYLVGEMIAKLGFSGLQYCGLHDQFICLLLLVMCVLSTMTLLTVAAPDTPEQDETKSDPMAKLWAVMKLWPDPKLWLLAPGNVTFGFSSAFINGIFVSRYVVPALGEGSVGLLSATTVLSASLAVPAFGYLGTRFGRGLVVFIGAISFLLISLFVSSKMANTWKIQLVLFYLLQGVGRAVYESTNRAIFSDFFQGAPDGAFANVVIQASISPAICFFLSDTLQESAILMMSSVSAVLIMVGYPLAILIRGGAETLPLLGPGTSMISKAGS